VRFAGSEERAVTVDRNMAGKEEIVETTVGNGIANGSFCSLRYLCAILRGPIVFFFRSVHNFRTNI